MKKHMILLAAAAAFAACSVEPVDRQPIPENIISFDAGFDGGETRSVRLADGKVRWLPGNRIGLFREAADNGGNLFVTDITAPSTYAQFKGPELPGSGYYYALYPYDPASRFDGSAFHTNLPANQEGVAGTFADDLFLSVARTRTQSMSFKHVCGGVKFSVEDEDIRRVLLVANGGEALAGNLTVGFNTQKLPVVQGISNPSSIIVMEPEDEAFEPGEHYHFVTVPTTLSEGFSLIFERWDDAIAIKDIDKSVTIPRAGFKTLANADAGLEWQTEIFEYSPDEVEVAAFGERFSIKVRSTVPYHVDVDPDCDWIVPVSTSGLPIVGATHTFKALRNTGDPRMAVVTVCTEGNAGNCFPVLVFQGDGHGLNSIVHHSLGMRFTATWCGWCPYMNAGFYLAKDELGDRFEIVNLHSSDSNLAFSGTSALSSQFHVAGYPTGIIDGRVDIDNNEPSLVAAAVAAAVEETEENYPPISSIGLSSTVSGRTASVAVDVYTALAEPCLLTVFLLEDGIVAAQSNNMTGGTTTDYVHDNIARIALTSPTGDAFTGQEQATQHFTFDGIEIPSGYDISNMTVLAYVQRQYGSQPVIRSDDYGDYYIDNCRIVPLGASEAPEVY